MVSGSYLDNGMFTQMYPEVWQSLQKLLLDGVTVYDLKAPYSPAQKQLKLLEQITEKAIKLLRADLEDTFVFTSSSEEAISHVIQGVYYEYTLSSGKTHFCTSAIEQASIILNFEKLEELHTQTTLLKVNRHGLITPEIVQAGITPRTVLVSLSWVHPLTGVVQPVEAIGKCLQEQGILFHVDGSLAFGRMEIDLQQLPFDFFTLGGSLIHGPASTGLLWIKKDKQLKPFIVGGAEQKDNRSGHCFLPFIQSLVSAMEIGIENTYTHLMQVGMLRTHFEESLQGALEGVYPVFVEELRICHISCIVFEGVNGEALLFYLDQANVQASIGGASVQGLPIVLEACGIEPSCACAALSFGFSSMNTKEEVDYAIERIVESVTKLRKISYRV